MIRAGDVSKTRWSQACADIMPVPVRCGEVSVARLPAGRGPAGVDEEVVARLVAPIGRLYCIYIEKRGVLYRSAKCRRKKRTWYILAAVKGRVVVRKKAVPEACRLVCCRGVARFHFSRWNLPWLAKWQHCTATY
jgi:hypothetical protein